MDQVTIGGPTIGIRGLIHSRHLYIYILMREFIFYFFYFVSPFIKMGLGTGGLGLCVSGIRSKGSGGRAIIRAAYVMVPGI